MEIKVKLSVKRNIEFYGATEITIDLEEYLVGCVAAEIGNAPLEACKAQAVASRTFALNAIKSKGYITDKSSVDQAFRVERLTGYSNAAEGVKETAGEVLYYDGKLAKAYYSSSNGGYMISTKTRWGGELPYSVGGADPFDNGDGRGHGVQLSQTGAKNRAKSGQNYQEILSFYYPSTQIVLFPEADLYRVTFLADLKNLNLLKQAEVVYE